MASIDDSRWGSGCAGLDADGARKRCGSDITVPNNCTETFLKIRCVPARRGRVNIAWRCLDASLMGACDAWMREVSVPDPDVAQHWRHQTRAPCALSRAVLLRDAPR
eukprot:677625-Rhodomonas_salina.2